ncbi:DUF4234 domain-containing protein [Ruminococcaceae bacterium OttesenSCG-928-L11]|nr:DUF4234 domain-containing protein [Ruminococcaceae bacterium OttesenSCG-928-L11]
MTQKNIALNIILSVVTCGIYGIYWYYCIATDIYNSRNNISTTPILTIVLNLVTCGIYGIYVYYKWGKAMYEVCTERGIPCEDRSILYLILSIFGLAIVNMALIQSDLNQMAA